MARKILDRFVILFSLLLLSINSYGQPQTYNDLITPNITKKIYLWCNTDRTAFNIFAGANEAKTQNSVRLTDKILSNLGVNLDCAKNFIIVLYQNFGINDMYHTLKDVGFSISEIEAMESIYNEQVAEWKKEKFEKQKLKESNTLTRINRGESFEMSDLIKPLSIDIDIYDIGSYIGTEQRSGKLNSSEIIDCTFNCQISKDNQISLLNNYTLTTDIKRLVWESVHKGAAINGSAQINLKTLNITEQVPVDVKIEIKQTRKKYTSPISFTIKKNKTTKQWEVLNKEHIEQYFIRQKRQLAINFKTDIIADNIIQDIYGLLNYDPYFTELQKGTYNVSLYFIRNEISSYINGKLDQKEEMPYTFEFKCEKRSTLNFY